MLASFCEIYLKVDLYMVTDQPSLDLSTSSNSVSPSFGEEGKKRVSSADIKGKVGSNLFYSHKVAQMLRL